MALWKPPGDMVKVKPEPKLTAIAIGQLAIWICVGCVKPWDLSRLWILPGKHEKSGQGSGASVPVILISAISSAVAAASSPSAGSSAASSAAGAAAASFREGGRE